MAKEGIFAKAQVFHYSVAMRGNWRNKSCHLPNKQAKVKPKETPLSYKPNPFLSPCPVPAVCYFPSVIFPFCSFFQVFRVEGEFTWCSRLLFCLGRVLHLWLLCSLQLVWLLCSFLSHRQHFLHGFLHGIAGAQLGWKTAQKLGEQSGQKQEGFGLGPLRSY